MHKTGQLRVKKFVFEDRECGEAGSRSFFYLYLYIFVFVYVCICIFVFLWVEELLPREARESGEREVGAGKRFDT